MTTQSGEAMDLKLLRDPEAFVVSRMLRSECSVHPSLTPVSPCPWGAPVTAETAALGQQHYVGPRLCPDATSLPRMFLLPRVPSGLCKHGAPTSP